MVSRMIWGPSQFDELVDKATSELLPKGQEDLVLSLDVCDQIRSKSVSAKDAMRALKRRIDHSNPNVQLLALGLTDACVKNGGNHFLIEIASREFVDNLVSLVRTPTGGNSEVKIKILGLIQTWGIAFEGKPELRYVTETYRSLKAEDYQFPRIEKTTTAVMIDTATPPEWTDSDVCMRCRTSFTTFNRKHHCRNCGQTFCGDCSSKTMELPHIGMNDRVRVCESCFSKKHSKARSASVDQTVQRPVHSSISHSHSNSLPNGNPNSSSPNLRRDDDDEDIKKAIELSLKEAESSRVYSPPQSKVVHKAVEAPKKQDEEEDVDLAAAIAASLREMNLNQAHSTNQSQYATSNYPGYDIEAYRLPATNVSPHELSPIEAENIHKFADIVDRIEQSGSDLMRDRQVQELNEIIGQLKPKLTKTLSETIQKHQDLVDIHEKLAQVVKLYDRLLEEKLASTYTRRVSTSYPSRQRVGSLASGSIYPILSTATNANVYPQLSYPVASAPAQSPTYFAVQSLASTSQYSQQPSVSSADQPQQYQQSQQYQPSKQLPYAPYSHQPQAPYAPTSTLNNNAATTTTITEYQVPATATSQQEYPAQPNGVPPFAPTSGYSDAGFQQLQQQPVSSTTAQPQTNFYQYQHQSYQQNYQPQQIPPHQPQQIEERPLIEL
ncbi:hypothetical protein G9A89_010156 [Geosiphon pyriformis]|nr:hypothetical protein G9A89_010156 [Geosiphon pyriformis]